MIKELIPYYISRVVFAALLGWFASSEKGLLIGILMGGFLYAGFLWYAHSGRYLIDITTPLFPLRRDYRGNVIRDRALVTSVGVAGLLFFLFAILETIFSLGFQIGRIALITGIATYFIVTNLLFVRNGSIIR